MQNNKNDNHILAAIKDDSFFILDKFILDYFDPKNIEDFVLFFSIFKDKEQQKEIYNLNKNKLMSLIEKDKKYLSKIISVFHSDLLDNLMVNSSYLLETIEDFFLLFSGLNEEYQILVYNHFKEKLFVNRIFYVEDFDSLINIFQSEVLYKFIIDYSAKPDSIQGLLDLFLYCNESSKKKLYSLFKKEKNEENIFNLFKYKLITLINEDIRNLKEWIHLITSKEVLYKIITASNINSKQTQDFINLFSNLDKNEQITIYYFIKDKLFESRLFSEEDFNSLINIFKSKELIIDFIIEYGFKLDSTQDILDLFIHFNDKNQEKLYKIFEDTLNKEKIIDLIDVLTSKKVINKLVLDNFELKDIENFYLLFSNFTKENQEKIYNLFGCQIKSLVKKDSQGLKKIINVLNSKNALSKLIVNSGFPLKTIDNFYSLFSGLTEKDQEKIYDLFRCQIEPLVKKDIQDLKKIINVLNSKDVLSELIVNSGLPLKTIDNFYYLFYDLTEREQNKIYDLFADQLLELAQNGKDVAKILNFLPPDAFNKFFLEKQIVFQSMISRNNGKVFGDINKLFVNLDENKFTEIIRCLKKTDLAKHFQSPLVVNYIISDVGNDKKLKVFETCSKESLIRPISKSSDLQNLAETLSEKEIKALCQGVSFRRSLHSMASSIEWKFFIKLYDSKSYKKIKSILKDCPGECLPEKSASADKNRFFMYKKDNENPENNPNPNNNSNSNLVPGIENNTVRIK